jgi:hypothetical protein
MHDVRCFVSVASTTGHHLLREELYHKRSRLKGSGSAGDLFQQRVSQLDYGEIVVGRAQAPLRLSRRAHVVCIAQDGPANCEGY